MNKFRLFCLLLCCSLVCLNGFSPLVSYAADNMFRVERPYITYSDRGWAMQHTDIPKEYNSDTGFYKFSSVKTTGTYSMSFGSSITYSETLQYLPDIYDYYVIITAYSNCAVSEFTFKPDIVDVVFNNCDDSPRYTIDEIECYHHDSAYMPYTGFTITFKLPKVNSTSINYIDMIDENTANLPSTDMYLRMEIVKVEKNQSIVEMGILADKLEEINNSIIEYGDRLHNDMENMQQAIENQYNVSEDENFGVEDIVEELNDKVGALTFASDTLIGFMDLFNADNVGDTTLKFPTFKMKVQGETYEIWGEYEYDFAEIENNFGVLVEAVRWFTTMVVYASLVSYIGKCWNDIMRG